ncbi:MAG: GntR family transcriptional regulator [Gemmatimonadetes bacterium]|nr:GntR family transcriptional regulator [Gemmatimonadota bacterium]
MYLQIIEQVRQRIALGDWPAGFPLPSIRELSAELRVSVITVKRAYLELGRDGVIVTRQDRSVVAECPDLSDRLFEAQLQPLLDALAHLAVRNHLPIEALRARLAEAIRRAEDCP